MYLQFVLAFSVLKRISVKNKFHSIQVPSSEDVKSVAAPCRLFCHRIMSNLLGHYKCRRCCVQSVSHVKLCGGGNRSIPFNNTARNLLWIIIELPPKKQLFRRHRFRHVIDMFDRYRMQHLPAQSRMFYFNKSRAAESTKFQRLRLRLRLRLGKIDSNSNSDSNSDSHPHQSLFHMSKGNVLKQWYLLCNAFDAQYCWQTRQQSSVKKLARTSYCKLGVQLPCSEPKWPQWPNFNPSKSKLCIKNNGPCPVPPDQLLLRNKTLLCFNDFSACYLVKIYQTRPSNWTPKRVVLPIMIIGPNCIVEG